MKAPSTKPEFKQAVRSLMDEHGRTHQMKWVWTWKGKYPTGLPGMTGYFIYFPKGASPALYFAEWSQGHSLRIKQQTPLSWQLLSQQDQSVIKGGSGQVPSPAQYKVVV